MKRQTAKAHGFEHGQTILFAGQGIEPWPVPVKMSFCVLSRRVLVRDKTGQAINIQNSAPFWAAPALPSAESLLHSMVSEYVTQSRREGVDRQTYPYVLSGWAQALIHAAMVAYGLSVEGATERVGDMINDIETGRD